MLDCTRDHQEQMSLKITCMFGGSAVHEHCIRFTLLRVAQDIYIKHYHPAEIKLKVRDIFV